jgi:hypothetical protein
MRDRSLRLLAAAVCMLMAPGDLRLDAAESPRDQRQSTVGIPARIEQIILPGPELAVRRVEDVQSPLVLRIAGAWRHGTDYRYDLVYYALEPGKYNLADYLRRKDGSAAESLPPINVEVLPVLPSGQITPNELAAQPPPLVGGYRRWAIAGAILWLAGLYAIFFVGRKRRQKAEERAAPVLSLSERLRSLLEEAKRGGLTKTRQAELERLVLASHRERLGLDETDAGSAIEKMKNDPQASAAIERLEKWLHSPDGAISPDEMDDLVAATQQAARE